MFDHIDSALAEKCKAVFVKKGYPAGTEDSVLEEYCTSILSTAKFLLGLALRDSEKTSVIVDHLADQITYAAMQRWLQSDESTKYYITDSTIGSGLADALIKALGIKIPVEEEIA